ncbi:GDSL lipase/esterase domain-containing protein [Forsythia ovata]|uniref:GDSL lipase/esterase domain-containing protein n=1 Tax=Forsythia ovata TaxID=205694 RepID=A0ABD1WMW5_9LAMI
MEGMVEMSLHISMQIGYKWTARQEFFDINPRRYSKADYKLVVDGIEDTVARRYRQYKANVNAYIRDKGTAVPYRGLTTDVWEKCIERSSSQKFKNMWFIVRILRDYGEKVLKAKLHHSCQRPFGQTGCKSRDVHEWQRPEGESQQVNSQDRPSQYFILLPLAIGAQQVPCFFIFGDSLIDNGNNNDLVTQAKANYLPYGIDFRGGPTGRFTNGLNTADILAKLLGFENYVPPFATAQGQDFINGVNYGSGSAGIRSETGQHLGDRISLDRQLINHNLTVSRNVLLLGNDTSAKQHLGKCLYTLVIGSNDYINNYYMPQNYSTSSSYTPDQYATVLIQQYSQQLKILYNYGARKVSVFGLGPIGCTPAELAMGTNGSICVDSINNAVQLFNDKLRLLVDDLNKSLTDAKFIYINAMEIMSGFLPDLGMRLLGTPCCKVSAIGQCIPGQAPCLIRPLHLFYDNFHPTETVNLAVAARAYISLLSSDAYPFDIQTLIQFKLLSVE